ncbi:MAG TPA: MarR family transcriptional regulator [Candidatus Nitrosotalea sp.]|nr:MarR family transcriptional regulator [Candidatus Nitrosotalea sp.]
MARNSEVAGRLHSVAIRVLRHAREADRESGLGPARLSALSVLVFGGPCTLTDLASAEQVSAPTMSRVVQGLQRAGLARREASTRDARASIVHATEKGKAILKRARQARLKRVEMLLEHAKPQDVSKLGAALAAVFAEPGAPER